MQQAISLFPSTQQVSIFIHSFQFGDSLWKLSPHSFLIVVFLISRHGYYSGIQPSVTAYLIPPLIKFLFFVLFCFGFFFLWPLYSQAIRHHILLLGLEFFQFLLNTSLYNLTCFAVNYPRIFFSLNITLSATLCFIFDISICLYVSSFSIKCNMQDLVERRSNKKNQKAPFTHKEKQTFGYS